MNPKELAHAYRFLANYNLKVENYEEAYIAAQKCAEFPEVITFILFFIMIIVVVGFN